jgi:hypothetical protein
MNKYICKIACMVIGLTLMLGCNSTRNRAPSIESENTFIKTTSTTKPINFTIHLFSLLTNLLILTPSKSPCL